MSVSPFKNRPSRRLVAAIGTVAALAVAVVPAGASVADHPAYPASLPTGYVSALPNSAWTISEDRATTSASMPGNAPGAMTISLGDDSRDRTFTTRADSSVTDPLVSPTGYAIPRSVSVATKSFDDGDVIRPEVFDCLGDSTAFGFRAECTTYTLTLTFPRPQFDPVVFVGTGSVWSVPFDPTEHEGPVPPFGCWLHWGEPEIVAVDGSGPGAGRVGLLDAISFDQTANVWRTPTATLQSNRLSTADPFVAENDDDCVPKQGASFAAVEVKGTVSSVTIAMHSMVQITKTLTGTYNPVSKEANIALGVSLPAADLSIEKTGPAAVDGRGAIDWGLTVSNAPGSADSHGFVIHDAIPAEVSDPEIVSAPPGCTLVAHELTCALVPDGYSVAPNATVPTFADLAGGDPAVAVPSVLGAGDSIVIRLRGQAPLSSADGITNTATVSGVDIDPDTSGNSTTVTTRVTPSTWTLAKIATVDGAAPADGVVQPGDILTYTVTAASTHGPVPGIVMTDDLSAVLDHALFVPGSARLTVADGEPQAIADPAPTTLTTPSFDLAQGQQAVLTYQVRVGATAWSVLLRNAVTGTSEVPLTSCDPCTTATQTGALVNVQKNGVDDEGRVVPVSGAAFEVLRDDDGTPGAIMPGRAVAAVEAQTGRFEIRGLAPGTYWLNETKAPVGHVLLARPAAFTVSATGALALVRPGTDANVTIADGVITVGDGKAVALPFTGAAGMGILVGSGAVVLLLAAVAALLIRRRTAPTA